uniref:Uncharacterized protein n=1 Tax=Arundo donax TaxID=35708 RepID=A0A0A8ZFB2_ARUDO
MVVRFWQLSRRQHLLRRLYLTQA